MKLYKMYADHLYSRGEYEAAVEQFCHTIGYVQSSYVVRKFLEPQRMRHLVVYLERLLEKGMASSDHVTLLASCLVKVKDEPKLEVRGGEKLFLLLFLVLVLVPLLLSWLF